MSELFNKPQETAQNGQAQEVVDTQIITNGDPVVEAFSGLPSVVEEKDYFVEEVEKAEKRLEALNKQRMLILKLTRPYDWVNFGGRAYLSAYGAERLMLLFNISYKIGDPEIKYDQEGHFTVIFRGTFTWGDKTIEEIGIRSSRDPFFSRAHKQDIPPHQIRLSDVIKSARSNLIARGVSTLLGLRGLSIQDVTKMVGKIDQHVEFKTKEIKNNG
jgi:hypothetical protein